MSEKPAEAVRAKPDSSLVGAVRAVAEGRADAVVSAGNTGADARRRPAPSAARSRRPAAGHRRADPRPRRGSISDRRRRQRRLPARAPRPVRRDGLRLLRARSSTNPDPAVRLLSIGEEPEKGNQLTIEAHALLAERRGIRFDGNAEARDLLRGAADVVVTDGFTGNIALKLLEGTIKELLDLLREEISATTTRQARRPADPAGRAAPAHAARPRHLRRRVPARPAAAWP